MKNNERGSALIMVIFAMMMIMLLSVTLSTSLIVNYKMKQNETFSEQELYINQACMVYTQAYLENVINTAVIESAQDGFLNIIRTNEETDEEYEERVLDEMKLIYNSKLSAAQSQFADDLDDQMIVVKNVNYSSMKALSDIDPTVESCVFSDGNCTVSYAVTIDSKETIFKAQFNWEPYTSLEKACTSIIGGGDDIDYVKVSTIFG